MIWAPQMRAARQRFADGACFERAELAPLRGHGGGALGHGGVSAMARVSGLARSTIYMASDIRCNITAPTGRIRRPGGGRERKVLEYPKLLADLKRLVAPSTRGDPGKPLLWTSRSLRNLAGELARQGHRVCPRVVGELLRGLGYSLQANSKTKEGGQHIDRDAQFRTSTGRGFLAAQEPVISVDTKKKELVGNFKNAGREWHPEGRPEPVNVHDFIDPSSPAPCIWCLRHHRRSGLGQCRHRSRHRKLPPLMRSAAGGRPWERNAILKRHG